MLRVKIDYEIVIWRVGEEARCRFTNFGAREIGQNGLERIAERFEIPRIHGVSNGALRLRRFACVHH
jgi:hypothetical protein